MEDIYNNIVTNGQWNQPEIIFYVIIVEIYLLSLKNDNYKYTNVPLTM